MRQYTNHHWFRQWLVAWSAPSHYRNQWWNIVNWTLGNKLQWNFDRNSNIFIEENAFENVVCEMASTCFGLNVLKFVIFVIIPVPYTVSYTWWQDVKFERIFVFQICLWNQIPIFHCKGATGHPKTTPVTVRTDGLKWPFYLPTWSCHPRHKFRLFGLWPIIIAFCGMGFLQKVQVQTLNTLWQYVSKHWHLITHVWHLKSSHLSQNR